MSTTKQNKDRVLMGALSLLPKNALSRAVGALAEIKLPAPAQAVVNASFAYFAKIDTGEAERPPKAYASVNAYFTRKLKSGARPIATRELDALVSPVDGRITQFGSLCGGTLLQAKGRTYDLTSVLDSARDAKMFSQGKYATIYLSPSDYHRIHSPGSGVLERVSYVPGQLWPVNPLSVRHVDRLFAVNERLITYIRHEVLGKIAVIKVGATCVGRIGLAFHDLESNGSFRRRQDIDLEQGKVLKHGDDLAVFNLGSTVILLIANPHFAFAKELVQGQKLKMGEFLGRRSVA